MKKILALALVALMAAAMMVPMSAADVDAVDALYFEDAPEFDGVITEDEWGEPTVIGEAGAAAYYQHAPEAADIEMNIWLRWDEDYLYIGVTSPDNDGQSLQAGENSNWNGDSIQFRADPKGSNGSGDKNSPWSSNEQMPNLSMGYLTNDKKANMYDHRTLIDANSVCKYAFGEDDGIFTWEVAVPHDGLCKNFPDAKIEAGFEYGITLVRLNAPTGAKYNAWATWGDGVCGPQDNSLRVGSNPVTLSDEPAVVIEEVVEEAPAADAGTAAPTADASYAMFAILAIVSLAGAVYVTKKSR